MNRSAIRENAFKLIYSLEIQDVENLEEQIELFFESNEINDEEAKKYVNDVIFGIEKNKQEILNEIEKNLKEDWKLSRISKMDLSILKLAIYEIKYNEIPFKVAINEAVNVAKKYEEPETVSFINGVLGSYVRAKQESV